MTAASYWSLLAPAIEMAEQSGSYGENGQWAFVPVAVGFAIGAVFVFAADKFLPLLVGIIINIFNENFKNFIHDNNYNYCTERE